MKSVTVRLDNVAAYLLDEMKGNLDEKTSAKVVIKLILESKEKEQLIHDQQVEIAALKKWSSEQAIVVAHLRYLDK